MPVPVDTMVPLTIIIFGGEIGGTRLSSSLSKRKKKRKRKEKEKKKKRKRKEKEKKKIPEKISACNTLNYFRTNMENMIGDEL